MLDPVMSLPRPDSAAITLLVPVSTVPEAVAAQARLVDVGSDDALIPAIRRELRDVRICGRGEGADIVRDAGLAARTGACLICPDAATAADAVRLGIAAERILVQTAPAAIAAAARSGWATLVDLEAVKAAGRERTNSLAGAEAVAAVSAWLGVTVIRTRHVTEIRRCVEMTESILGRRPPARTLRGLA